MMKAVPKTLTHEHLSFAQPLLSGAEARKSGSSSKARQDSDTFLLWEHHSPESGATKR